MIKPGFLQDCLFLVCQWLNIEEAIADNYGNNSLDPACGCSLSLIPGVDAYRKLTPRELAKEQKEKPSVHDSLSKHAGQQAVRGNKEKIKKAPER